MLKRKRFTKQQVNQEGFKYFVKSIQPMPIKNFPKNFRDMFSVTDPPSCHITMLYLKSDKYSLVAF
jgi:hypothetical protein